MACHLAECGCINEEGNFPCAIGNAIGWCPNHYLVLTDYCQDRKYKCVDYCNGTWCGNKPELCSPTVSPVPINEPSYFPTYDLSSLTPTSTIEPITSVPSISPALTSAPSIRPKFTSAPTSMPTKGPSTVVTAGGPDLTSLLSVWHIIGFAVGGGILIGVICYMCFYGAGRSKREKSGHINIHALNIVGNEDVGTPPGDVEPNHGEPDIVIPEGREKIIGYPGIASATTIELDPDSPKPQFIDQGQSICTEGAVLPQRTTSASIIRRTRMEGERSTGVTNIIPSNSKTLGAYENYDKVEPYLRSPNGENNVAEKDTLPVEHLLRLENYSPVESPSMSANDFPDLPSPNWDRPENLFDSKSRPQGMVGEQTEAGPESATDIYAVPGKRRTLGGNEEVDADEKSVNEIEFNTAAWISQERVD